MPHSSGGGSHGGGFHGGSGFHRGSHGFGSSSHSYIRHSRHYFPGAHTFYYYHCGQPHLIYSNSEAGARSLSGEWLAVIISAIFLIFPFIFILPTCFNVPKHLSTNYNTSIVIEDNGCVLSDEQMFDLNNEFMHFFDVTGITPSFVSLDTTGQSKLERIYENTEYLIRFSDEKHWLFVYEELGDDWAFETSQGYETDNILTEKVATKFTKNVYDNLEQGNDIYTSLMSSFKLYTPNIMKTSFEFPSDLTSLFVVWPLITCTILVVSIVGLVNGRHMKGAEKLPEGSTLANCPYCDAPYYTHTITKCPKCGAHIDDGDPNHTMTIKDFPSRQKDKSKEEEIDNEEDRFAVNPDDYKIDIDQ